MLNTKAQDWNILLALEGDKAKEVWNDILLGQIMLKEYNEWKNVYLFAQPKSGSHHVLLLLQLALGLWPHPAGFNIRNNNLYYPRVLASKFLVKDTISRSHEPCTIETRKMIWNLGLYPVVLTRNLLDAIVSRRDHIFRTDPGDDIKSEREYKKFLQADSEHQLDVTIEKFANGMIEFYTSWAAYQADLVWITWEEMVSDPAAMIGHVAEELDLEVVKDVDQITAEIKAVGGANLNKGVAGRGREQLNERQIADIMRRAEILGCDDEEFLL